MKNITMDLSVFEAFIFDMDGVIVDSENMYTQNEQLVFSSLGLKISSEEHAAFQGTATRDMWKILKSRYGLKQSLENLIAASNQLAFEYFEKAETIEPIPGIRALLGRLRQKNIPTALASSSTSQIIEIILQKTQLRDFFSVIVDSTMVAESKPAPDIFLLAAKKLNVSPQKCVVIEDSTNGIAAAKSAEMFCIAFQGAFANSQDQSAADVIISDFESVCRNI